MHYFVQIFSHSSMSQRRMQNLQKYVTGKFTSFYIRVWSESFDKIFLC